MLVKVTSCAVIGFDGTIVEVEVDISRGLPSPTIVGLPDAAVQEARESSHKELHRLEILARQSFDTDTLVNLTQLLTTLTNPRLVNHT